MPSWSPWHGCTKYSSGCQNCYVYRIDSKHDKDASIVYQTKQFYAPIKRKRTGEYQIPSGSYIYTCFSSDFFLDIADQWRTEAWKIIKERSDCHFTFLTKRIERFFDCLPLDWHDGYDNVTIGCTVENNSVAQKRLPIFVKAPIKNRIIICEPLLSAVDLTKYLDEKITRVIVGGESGLEARICNYNWILDIRKQCIQANVPFYFKQTGTYLYKDGKKYVIPKWKQSSQAKRANINYLSKSLMET